MDRPLFSVLIVNYQGARVLRGCLESLSCQSLPRYQFEVIVFDNASTDGSAEIAGDFPFAKRIRSSANVGFAEGNNRARALARGRYLVLLNNDTMADPHWLEELARAVAESPDSRFVSKLLLTSAGAPINSGGLVLLRDGRGADAGFREPDRGQYEEERAVFAGCGAALIVPADRPGDLFDASLFAYYEDLDAGWSGQSQRQPTRYLPRAVVRHHHGAAAGEQSPLFRMLVERNRALMALRHGDPFLAIASSFLLMTKTVLAIPGLLFGTRRAHSRALVKALGSWFVRLPGELTRRFDARSGGVRCASF